MTTANKAPTDWLNAFLPIGVMRNAAWDPRGGGVLLLDNPIVWLVTARAVVEAIGDDDAAVWVPNQDGCGLLNLSEGQRQTDTAWVHHPVGLSATMFPLDASLRVKAFAEAQCTRVRNLQPLQPAASVGCPYSAELPQRRYPTPVVCDGIVSSADQDSGHVLTTAPLLPLNAGAPLLLASPYGGAVTLAGILLENTMVGDADPRVMPLRFGHAICVDAALELVRGQDATAQRRRVTEAVRARDDAAPGTGSEPPAGRAAAGGDVGEASS